MSWKTRMYLSLWLWNDPTAHTLRAMIHRDPEHAVIYRRALRSPRHDRPLHRLRPPVEHQHSTEPARIYLPGLRHQAGNESIRNSERS